MDPLLTALAPLLFIVLIFWVLLHGPTRARTGRAVRRGADRVSFWGWPRRDTEVARGALLVVLASLTLAEVVFDTAIGDPSGELVIATAFFGGIVAAGFALVPAVTKTAMGVLALVVITTERMGTTGCAAAATPFQNLVWFGSAGIFVGSVFALSALFSLIGFGPASVGGDERPIGSRLVASAGVLELLNLLLRPEGFQALEKGLATPALLGFVTACLLVVVLGLATLPHFTASVAGVGVGLGSGALLVVEHPPCRDIPTLVAIAICFFLVWFLVRRLRR